jgi:hypothetical protein
MLKASPRLSRDLGKLSHHHSPIQVIRQAAASEKLIDIIIRGE